MKKFVGFLLTFLFLFSFSYGLFLKVSAEPNCDNPSQGDLDYCIQKIGEEIAALAPAHEQNKKDLANLRSQIASIQSKINALTNSLKKTESDIGKREEDLAYATEIFNEKSKAHYKFIRLYDPLAPFFGSKDASEAFREISLRQKAADQDRELMEKYASDIKTLFSDKKKLEENKTSLANSKAALGDKESFLAGEVEKVEAYIATLSAKQESFLAQKLGSLNLPTSLGAGPLYCTDDRNRNPGFSPAFAFFTYGIPHRVGLNQYGAYGRAKAGQNSDQILSAYFTNFNFETKSDITITVDGYGAMSMETYLLGIYEMPGDWPLEALKAQAIAARSYAWAYTNGGAKSICTSQKCQVYKGGNKGGNWEQAVKATAGRVMTSGGQVITAWYASTAGGYTFNSGDVWGNATSYTKRFQDTASGVSDFSALNSSAYDKDSPCFYAAQGWRKDYDSSAWLKSEEVADIVNVLKLAKADSSVTEHLYQVDKANPAGTDTWDAGRVRSELSTRGITPLTGVSSVSVGADFGVGQSTTVTIDGQSFDAKEFKNYFNLRAPANIQIVGLLFNVEKK